MKPPTLCLISAYLLDSMAGANPPARTCWGSSEQQPDRHLHIVNKRALYGHTATELRTREVNILCRPFGTPDSTETSTAGPTELDRRSCAPSIRGRARGCSDAGNGAIAFRLERGGELG
jgi:hypothetical protein